MEKSIKNEVWSVNKIMSIIDNKKINKPKYQRPTMWNNVPLKKNDDFSKKTKPDIKSFIQFLNNTLNSVTAVILSKNNDLYSAIDGNNRIIAIRKYTNRPFEIFPEYLDELNSFIKNYVEFNNDDKKLIAQMFKEMSYDFIINQFKYNKYFIENGYIDLYNDKLKKIRDEFEKIIDDVIDKLKMNKNCDFGEHVKININIFEGYTATELCELFLSINKYDTKLQQNEILASSLFQVYDFEIKYKLSEIKEEIKLHYKNMEINEVLSCYVYDIDNGHINAHDFIIGFQNVCSNEYIFIEKANIKDDMTLFYKLYKAEYNDLSDKTFSTENINNFILLVIRSCELLKELYYDICFNKYKNTKSKMFITFGCIFGFIKKETSNKIIIQVLTKPLLYTLFVNKLKNKDLKKQYEVYDYFCLKGGGVINDNIVNILSVNPYNIQMDNLKPKIFDELINELYRENIEKNNNKLIDYEEILLLYYYKKTNCKNIVSEKISVKNHYSLKSLKREDELYNRLGNIYIKVNGEKDDIKESNNIINYNEKCIKNEEIYKNTFIKNLFN